MSLDSQLAILLMLTFIIHLVGTLAYSVRIAGTRTQQIALSFSLFNIMMLVSRTSNSFQGPLLAKRIEENLRLGILAYTAQDFRLILYAASCATVAGALLMPTFQRLFTTAVLRFKEYRSVPRLFLRGMTPRGLKALKQAIVWPARANLSFTTGQGRIPIKFLLMNAVATAIWTVGVFSSLYAGYLNPQVRVTSSQLSSIINGVATILLFIFIDPYLSVLTDDVALGNRSQAYFRRAIVWLTGSRLVGTLLAQVLLKPAANLIVFVAERI